MRKQKQRNAHASVAREGECSYEWGGGHFYPLRRPSAAAEDEQVAEGRYWLVYISEAPYCRLQNPAEVLYCCCKGVLDAMCSTRCVSILQRGENRVLLVNEHVIASERTVPWCSLSHQGGTERRAGLDQ